MLSLSHTHTQVRMHESVVGGVSDAYADVCSLSLTHTQVRMHESVVGGVSDASPASWGLFCSSLSSAHLSVCVAELCSEVFSLVCMCMYIFVCVYVPYVFRLVCMCMRCLV
jgi:hypothetical protein